MRAHLIRHIKVLDELGHIVEIKMWQLPQSTKDKPHGYKYSLVYIVDGKRVIGYDNGEGQGDHRHVKQTIKPYEFINLKKLTKDFYNDIEKFNRGEL